MSACAALALAQYDAYILGSCVHLASLHMQWQSGPHQHITVACCKTCRGHCNELSAEQCEVCIVNVWSTLKRGSKRTDALPLSRESLQLYSWIWEVERHGIGQSAQSTLALQALPTWGIWDWPHAGNAIAGAVLHTDGCLQVQPLCT